MPEMRMGWRQLYARGAEEARISGESSPPPIGEGFDLEVQRSETGTNLAVTTRAQSAPGRSRAAVFVWLGLGLALVIGSAVAAVAAGGHGRASADDARPVSATQVEPAQSQAAPASAPPVLATSAPVAAGSASAESVAGATSAESAKVGQRAPAPAPRAGTRKKRVFDATPDFRR
jgi:hypothetical protein